MEEADILDNRVRHARDEIFKKLIGLFCHGGFGEKQIPSIHAPFHKLIHQHVKEPPFVTEAVIERSDREPNLRRDVGDARPFISISGEGFEPRLDQ